MDMKVFNQRGTLNSLQVSVVKEIPTGDFEPGLVFLIKNDTEESLQVTLVPAGQTEEVTTTISAGWNPELVKKVINAPSGLKYGY